MQTEIQRDRAQTFKDRHTNDGKGPLILPNSWDAASTILYEAAGFEAVGTSSAAIAASLGVPDGEYLDRNEMLEVVERISNCVELPVSADIEAGYGTLEAEVKRTVSETIDAGAVGVNLEDGTDDQASPLLDPERHCAKIRAAREAADEANVPLVINGRTDVFWREVGDEADRVDHAIKRANAYYEAGSDCLFVPGVTDPEKIDALVDGIRGPLNVLGGPNAPPIPELGELGVARVSVGSGPMRSTLGHLQAINEELQNEGTYLQMENAIPYGELNELLVSSLDRPD